MNNFYAISKLAGEELVKAFSNEFSSFNYTILRYFNTYGPHQIAQFVIPKFISNVISGKSPIIYGNGMQKRSYNFSLDTARATADSLFFKSTNGATLNIGNNEEPINLIDLANLIIKICNKNESVKIKIKKSFHNADRIQNREIFQRYCDTTLAKKLIGYKSKIFLSEGIKKVIEVGAPRPTWEASEKRYMLDEF